MSAISQNTGPVVWLTACSHGDEVCGIVIIQEIFRRIRKHLLCGSIFAFPMLNPVGFETGSRNITLSREDLNRCFPGDPAGTLGRRIAYRIFTTIEQTSPDLVLDLHTDWKQSIPYTVLDQFPSDRETRPACHKARQFAIQTGLVCVQETDKLDSSLSYNLLLRQIPSITLELGEPDIINEANVNYGVKAIRNILAGLGMIPERIEPFNFPFAQIAPDKKMYNYCDRPYSSKSGIIRFLAKPGDNILRGQPFARIINAFGKHQETLKAEYNAIILGHSDSSVVFPGMPIMAFAIAQDSVPY